MDTSTALALFSILISVIFAVVAFYFSNKTDQTLRSVQEKINVQHDNFMKMLERAETNHYNYVITVTKILATKGGWSDKVEENFEEELKEALEVLRQPNLDPTSILSESKLGK
jgi:hypothetical protein